MFKKLQECKNFKEIFAMIGTRPFEITAYVVLILWCLLPIYFVFERAYWTAVAHNDYEHGYAITAGHQYAMRILGMVSLYVAIFYLLSRLSVHAKNILKKMNTEPWHFLLLLMLVWGGVSTLLASDLSIAWIGDGYLGEGYRGYLYYAGVYVCAFIIAKSKFKWILFNIFNIVANIVSLIIIIVEYTDIKFLELMFPGQLAGVFFHFNHAGYYINMGIVCAMGLYMHAKGKIRFWYAISMIIQVFGILVNSTFGAFLGSCGALVMILLFYVRRYSAWSKHMITPIIVVLSLSIASYFGCIPNSKGEDMRTNIGMFFDAGESLANQDEDAALIGHGRVWLWKMGLKMVADSPIFGYGPDHLDENHSEHMWINRPDNEFIQHAVFMGVPALLLYLGALIMLFVHQMKQMKELDRTILIAAGCMIAYLISAQFGVSAFYTTPYLYMFWGMAAGRSPKEQETIDAGLAELRAEVDATLEQRLLVPKKDKKRKKKGTQVVVDNQVVLNEEVNDVLNEEPTQMPDKELTEESTQEPMETATKEL